MKRFRYPAYPIIHCDKNYLNTSDICMYIVYTKICVRKQVRLKEKQIENTLVVSD